MTLTRDTHPTILYCLLLSEQHSYTHTHAAVVGANTLLL